MKGSRKTYTVQIKNIPAAVHLAIKEMQIKQQKEGVEITLPEMYLEVLKGAVKKQDFL